MTKDSRVYLAHMHLPSLKRAIVQNEVPQLLGKPRR